MRNPMNPNTPLFTGAGITGAGSSRPAWSTENAYWQLAFPSRPYATADLGYEYYRPAFHYGYDAAARYRGKRWSEVELELARGWDEYEHREGSPARWEQIQDAVHDAWDHVNGDQADDAAGATGRG